MKPVITLADVMQTAGTHEQVNGATVAAMTYKNALGVEMLIRVRLKFGPTGQIVIACPNCGGDCLGLHYHPAGRGLICSDCLRRQKRAS